jgi:hypothetical protein
LAGGDVIHGAFMRMIVVTWQGEHSQPVATLWRAEANREQYDYACESASRCGQRVHTFPTTMAVESAKAIAIKEHNVQWIASRNGIIQQQGEFAK